MNELLSSVNTIWVLVGAALVFFMQAGFAMVETGYRLIFATVILVPVSASGLTAYPPTGFVGMDERTEALYKLYTRFHPGPLVFAWLRHLLCNLVTRARSRPSADALA